MEKQFLDRNNDGDDVHLYYNIDELISSLTFLRDNKELLEF